MLLGDPDANVFLSQTPSRLVSSSVSFKKLNSRLTPDLPRWLAIVVVVEVAASVAIAAVAAVDGAVVSHFHAGEFGSPNPNNPH